jgi:hypothetical protein
MGIFRSNNVADYDQVDGIIIDESAPPGGIQGVGTGLVILAGQFERGSDEMSRMASLSDFHLKYGKSSYPGNIQLKNKKFSALKIIRVVASDAAKGTRTLSSAVPTATIKFDAKHKGVYGNKISVTVESGSVSGKKYTIKDTNTDASTIFPDEVYDNVVIASAATAFADSKLIDVTVLSTVGEPVNSAAAFLASGSDGTVADTDYETAIAKAEVEGAGNFLFIDVYNSTRNSYLKIHAGLTQDKMVIVSHAEADDVSDNIAAVATLRDTDGRIIFAENWVGTIIDGVDTFTSPASWYASILSQTAPYVDPAYAGNAGFLYGVTRLKAIHTRDEYIQLMQAGISAFEQDLDIGFKIKSGIVTQIANTSKLTVLRRRMADYLTNSIGRYLKIYQNDVNSKSKRDNVSAAINAFDTQQENLGILPRNSEVIGGKAKLIDTNSLNTNDTIAQGKFFIKYKRRIFSSMRFIVLVAEIGESVVVTEQDE